MVISLVLTHNPQDYFEGIEDAELSEWIVVEMGKEKQGWEKRVHKAVEDGYTVVIRQVRGERLDEH